MSTCPTYEACEGKYSPRGLRALSRSLTTLQDLPYSASEQVHEAASRAPKMSIRGVLIDYFGGERLGLNRKIISSVIDDLDQAMPVWKRWIGASFLPDKMKADYLLLLKTRWERVL